MHIYWPWPVRCKFEIMIHEWWSAEVHFAHWDKNMKNYLGLVQQHYHIFSNQRSPSSFCSIGFCSCSCHDCFKFIHLVSGRSGPNPGPWDIIRLSDRWKGRFVQRPSAKFKFSLTGRPRWRAGPWRASTPPTWAPGTPPDCGGTRPCGENLVLLQVHELK